MVVCEGSIVQPKKPESREKHGIGVVLEMDDNKSDEVFVEFQGGYKDWCKKDLLQSGDVFDYRMEV